MKYKIDKELKLISKINIPANEKLMPVLSRMTRGFRCRSDKDVLVTKYHDKYVIRPRKAEGPLPCLVFFHGGGFIMNAAFSHYSIAKEYAAKVPCVVIYADYRLCPEYKFPIQPVDCYNVYKWAVDNAEELGVDSKKIMVGGDSAGGNLAAVVSLMARDYGIQIPSKAMLIYPLTDRRMNTESMKEFTDTPLWNARLNEIMWKLYLDEKEYDHMEYASPMEAASLAEFPQTYIEVAEIDCLRDEGILFHERLLSEGVSSELYMIKGACHGFETAHNSTITRECMARRIEWLRK